MFLISQRVSDGPIRSVTPSATQHGWIQTVITAGWGQVNRILLLLYLMSAIPSLTYCAYKYILAGFEEGNGE